MNYFVIQVDSGQFWVEKNRFYDFLKLPLGKNKRFYFNQVLLMSHFGFVQFGNPFIAEGMNLCLGAKIIKHICGPKVKVYKMRPKKKTRKIFGNRLKITRLLVEGLR